MLTFARGPAVFVLSPTQVEAWAGGKTHSAIVRLSVELPESGSLWPAALRGLSDTVRPWAAAHGLAGRPAVVLYENPTVATRLTSLPGLSNHHACAAARLAALGSLGAGESTAQADASEAARDSGGESPRRHLVSAADRRAALEAIDDLIESAGLTLERVLPVEAVIMSSLVCDLQVPDDGVHGRLYVGLRQSWLSVRGDGSLLLFRPIGLGLDQLIDVLTRPISMSGSRADFSLTRERAARLLDTHGIPEREQVVDASCSLLGQHVLPLLQPVLQRFVVELKQSLRFGLSETQRRQLRLSLCGPGGAVAGLASIIGDAVEAPVLVEQQGRALRDSGTGFEFGLSADAIVRMAARCPNLLPPRGVGRQVVRRFNRAAWAGLALGATLLAADAWRTDTLIARERDQVNALSAQIDDSLRRAEAAAAARTRDAALRRVRNAVVATTGSPDLAALLREAALLAGPEIRFVRIDFDGGSVERALSAGPACELTIEGYALGPESEAMVTSFVDGLQHSALIESAAIGSVVRVAIDGRAARRFQVRVAPVAAGREARRFLAAAGEGE